MINTGIQKVVFAGTSRITEYFPRAGSRFLDATLRPILGSSQLSAIFASQNREILKRMKSYRSFLVIPDTHIGDTIMMQSSVKGLRDFFPDAEIDYVVNRTAASLVEGNPEITKIIPLFSGGLFPSASDIKFLKELVQSGKYDLCVNLCPFIQDRELGAPEVPVVNFVSHSPTVIRNENDPSEINHFLYQSYKFVRGLFIPFVKPIRPEECLGVETRFSNAAIDNAARFMQKIENPSSSLPIVFFNPDTACKFTLIPIETQLNILNQIARLDLKILLGEGHTMEKIGMRLFHSLPSASRLKVTVVPASLPLEVYSAAIDFCDVFITGDTGPMHIAATRRVSRSNCYQFKNQTAVLSIFGATTPRMSGYDSIQPGYLPANQNAPSWSYLAGSPCRNITCLNKMFKTCSNVRCFEEVEVGKLVDLIASHTIARRKKFPSRQKSAPEYVTSIS